MRAGATSSAALPRKNWVPTTTSSPWAARSSWAVSSSPVASGTGLHPAAPGHVDRGDGQIGVDELLGAAAAVARPPAEVGLGEDHRAQLEDAVEVGLRSGRAPRDVQVHGHELV